MRPEITCSIPLGATPMQLKKQEVDQLAAISKELHSVQHELQQTRQEFADYKAEQDERQRQEAAKAVENEKKRDCHELKLTTFTVCLTLFLEHIPDVTDFLYIAFKYLITFFE